MTKRVVVCAIALAVIVCGRVQFSAAADPAERYEKDIQAFEKQDQKSPPEPGGIVFVGSSTIRMWDLKKHFPDLPCVNRGFGGSHISDSVYFAKRIVTPYKPWLVVVAAGGNDLNAGKQPAEVVRDYQALVKIIREECPDAKIIYLAIKPSIQRWSQDAKIREVNAAIQEFVAHDDALGYIDTYPPFLGEDGKPRGDLLLPDGLHLNDEGYVLFSSIVRPYLEK